MQDKSKLRNVAIIAHVDHGKTTLVDALLKQSNTFRDNQAEMGQTLIMDSGDQEHERGITITAKQTAIYYNGYKINIIDTPGHADFSGEVERTLNMADGGPMPQTKFVLQKALEMDLKPIVVVNKIDKPAARLGEVEDEIADLFLELATNEEQLKYPVYYAIARDGKAGKTPELDNDLHAIFDAIINEIPEPNVDPDSSKGAQLLVAALAADSYLGKYAIGKIFRGKLKKNESVTIMKVDGSTVKGKIDRLFTYRGLGYKVSGRGELHLSVLIETMRREGYEMEVGRPEVVYKIEDGKEYEPVEELTVEVSSEFVGAVSQELGVRKAELVSQELTTTGATRFRYTITTEALIGLRNSLLTDTKGTAIMNTLPKGYQPVTSHYRQARNGALVASETGQSTAYALDMAQARGILYIPPQVDVYKGMIVGLSKKDELDINVCREKQLTNMRTHASDGAIQLTPYTQLSLEQCLDFLMEDELLEVTPKSLRLRKKELDPVMRKRARKN